MTAPRRRFEVIAPDWGQTHLTSDAVVAFVDDELSRAAHARAISHLAACTDCAAEVSTQGQARAALRSALMPALSSSLLRSLRSIPRDVELPGPPAGLAVTADGGLVQALRPVPPAPRARRGATVAVSGIALGALVLGASLLSADPAPDRGVFGGPVLNGTEAEAVEPAGGSVDARLQLPVARPASFAPAPAADPTDSETILRQLDAMPATFPVLGR